MQLRDALIERLNAMADNRGRWHADCPFCGAVGARNGGRGSYHFYLYDATYGRGARCWSCDWRGTYGDLARALDVVGDDTPAPPARALPVTPTPPWALPGAARQYAAWNGEPYRQQQIIAAWQAYKPLAAATIIRNGLSYSKLALYDEQRQQWYTSRHPRLLVPLWREGRIVGFKGRRAMTWDRRRKRWAENPADTGPSWLMASHSETVLMGLEDVGAGSTVIWCENLVDRLLAQEREPGVVAVASGGLTWQPGWIAALARRRPRHVLIWFDHDLSGNGSPHHHAAFLALWRAEQEARRRDNPRLAVRPFPTPPEPRGPKLFAELHAAGVAASLYPWPAGSPKGADLGWALMQDVTP